MEETYIWIKNQCFELYDSMYVYLLWAVFECNDVHSDSTDCPSTAKGRLSSKRPGDNITFSTTDVREQITDTKQFFLTTTSLK